MITLTLPDIEQMKKIRVRLDKPRIMTFKDNRKINPSVKTWIPPILKEYKGKKGIYLIFKNKKIAYIGATTNFEMRMINHRFLKKNPDIKFVFFLEEDNISKRFLYEMIYKFHYFRKVGPEWNYTK